MRSNFYVYLMTNQWRNVLYVGVTNDLQRRVAEHRNGTVAGFTKRYNVDQLVYCEHYTDIRFAITREKQIKGWSRAKNALITEVNPTWRDLSDEFDR